MEPTTLEAGLLIFGLSAICFGSLFGLTWIAEKQIKKENPILKKVHFIR